MSKRARWKSLLTLAAVLMVGVVATHVLLHRAQERTTFFGEADPMSGYRCRITLPSGWKQQPPLREMSENSFFVAPPLNPVQQWLDSNLLNRPVSRPPRIYLCHLPLRSRMPLRGFGLSGGYPEPKWLGRMQFLTHRHLEVGGYHATFIKWFDPALRTFRSETLYVSVPEHSTVYIVDGFAELASEERLDREMQALIPSLHIEKAATTTGSRR
jgi:hypothetical protein